MSDGVPPWPVSPRKVICSGTCPPREMAPGETQLTQMPYTPTSIASARVMPIRPAFAAA